MNRSTLVLFVGKTDNAHILHVTPKTKVTLLDGTAGVLDDLVHGQEVTVNVSEFNVTSVKINKASPTFVKP